MPKQYSTSAISTNILWGLLQERGASDAEISEKTGISFTDLQSPDKRTPLDQHLLLWELAINATEDPALGLHLPGYYNKGQHHFVPSIILSSATLLDGLKQWIRYGSLVCDADKFELRDHGDSVTLLYTNLSPAHENRWLPELYFSLMVEHFQQAIGSECVIEEISMAHGAPEYADEYLAIFNTKIRFDQSEYRVRWKKEALLVPLKSHDPYYHSILKKYADDSLQSHGQLGLFSAKVSLSIIEYLPRNMADIQTIADSFHMDRRTLLRKLKVEGTTFKELLEDTRKKLAHDYLVEAFSITQISFMLGFSATSSFQVAFKRWYNQSPGDYRRDHIAQ